MAAANGFGKVIVGQGGILSTPAASQRHPQIQGVRRADPVGQPQSRRAARGFRHQVQYRQWRPGAGEDHRRDLRALEDDRRATRSPTSRDVDIDKVGSVKAGDMTVEVIDPVADYAALMESLFDFDAIRAMFAGGFRMRFDAMHAVTGPYAKEILENRLGAPDGHGAQLHAAARFRRPSSRPEPGPRQGSLRRDDGRRTRPISARPRTATATAI